VATEDAALSSFNDKVDQVPLLQDHRNIVKFASIVEPIFQDQVGPFIKRTIKSGLEEMNYFQQRRPVARAIRNAMEPHMDRNERSIQPLSAQDANLLLPQSNITAETGFSGLSPFGTNQRSLQLTMELLLEHYPVIAEILGTVYPLGPLKDNMELIKNQLEAVRDPLGDTCNWILDEPLYRAWEDQSIRILFIRGTEGLGKSVLTKYIIQRLRRIHQQTAVVYFFCQSVGIQRTPAMVLRHVIIQLDRQRPGLIIKSLLDSPFTSFAGQFDVDVLWMLFVRMIEKIEVDVFVIIDGVSASPAVPNYFLRPSLLTISLVGRMPAKHPTPCLRAGF
jgi:hypothetical protein